MYTLTTRNTETEYATGDEAWEAWARRAHGREPGDSLSRDGTVLVYVPRAGGPKRRWVMGQIRRVAA